MQQVKSGSKRDPFRREAPAMPRLDPELIAGILRESGVPEEEARRRIAQDPELQAELDKRTG